MFYAYKAEHKNTEFASLSGIKLIYDLGNPIPQFRLVGHEIEIEQFSKYESAHHYSAQIEGKGIMSRSESADGQARKDRGDSDMMWDLFQILAFQRRFIAISGQIAIDTVKEISDMVR